MKCPICDQENSTMLCTLCGFDASRDYERYPTFGPVDRVPSVSAMRRNWHMLDQEKLEQVSSLLKVVLAIRYQKLTIEDPYVRTAHRRIGKLENECADTWLRYYDEICENQNFRKQIEQLETEKQENLQVIAQLNCLKSDLEKTLREVRKEADALKHENDSLKQNLAILRNRNNNLGKLKNELKRENAELETALEAERSKNVELNAALEAERSKNVELNAALEAERSKNVELNAALEAERSKGLISRLFNR